MNPLTQFNKTILPLLVAQALVALASPPVARADAVTDWNLIASNAIVVTAGQPPPVSVLHFAMVQGAFAQEASDSISIQVITTFDYPGGDVTQTIPEGINDLGDIVGLYVDSSGVTRGFVRFADGTFSPPIVEPNDTMGHTEGRGITDQRLICGWYIGSDGFAHGYFLDSGVFTEFDVSGADETIVDGLNDAGDFVGNYNNEAGSIAFSNIGGITAPIIIPGDRGNSFAYAINRSRQITGGYQKGGHIHGWWQDSDGTVYAPFDPPHSKQTLPFGVNDQGWVVGRFSLKGNAADGHGFLNRLGSDHFVIYDYPGATFTSFGGINNDGLICGRYQDDAGLFHGFLAQVVTGQ